MALRPELRRGAGGPSHPGEPSAAGPGRQRPGFALSVTSRPAPFRASARERGQLAVQVRRHRSELRQFLHMKFSSPNKAKKNEHFISETLEDFI